MEISVSKDCIAQAKEKMNKAIAHLEDELRNFRAGKANPAVFNAVMVTGDQTGEVMFYGKGAGKLPTASAVVADVIDCIKHFEARKYLFWEDSSNEDVISPEDSVTAMYIRVQTDDEDKAMDEAERLFGEVKRIYRSGEPNNELSFTIGEMRFGDIVEKLSQFESDGIKILSKIRIADF